MRRCSGCEFGAFILMVCLPSTERKANFSYCFGGPLSAFWSRGTRGVPRCRTSVTLAQWPARTSACAVCSENTGTARVQPLRDRAPHGHGPFWDVCTAKTSAPTWERLRVDREDFAAHCASLVQIRPSLALWSGPNPALESLPTITSQRRTCAGCHAILIASAPSGLIMTTGDGRSRAR